MKNEKYTQIKDSLSEVLKRTELLHRGDNALRGIPTGFVDLDSFLAGLQKGNLIVVASTPWLGKTTLVLDIARNVALKEKKAVGIISLDLSKERVVERLLTTKAEVDLWKVRTGRLSGGGKNNDLSQLKKAAKTLNSVPIFIYDLAGTNIAEVKEYARNLKLKEKIELLIVDSLDLLSWKNDELSRAQEITGIAQELKNLAVELEIIIIVTMPFTHSEKTRPSIRDFRRVGNIERAADIIIFLSGDKSNYEQKRIVELIVAENREGPTGTIKLSFDNEKVMFRPME